MFKKNMLKNKLDFAFLNKYKLIFWKWIKWSGGRSWGKKVFRGNVGSHTNRKFFLNINWTYFFKNISGVLQNTFKPFWKNFVLSFCFFPIYGILSLNLLENSLFRNDKIEINKNFQYFDFLSWGITTLLLNFPIGEICYNIQGEYSNFSSLVRSAGCSAKILRKDSYYALLLLPSGKKYLFSLFLYANFGLSARLEHHWLKNAGFSRYLGKIPKVWGIAMNPVDHPHGGRTDGGVHPKTPKGFLTWGVKTRKKKCWSNNRIYWL